MILYFLMNKPTDGPNHSDSLPEVKKHRYKIVIQTLKVSKILSL